MQLRLEIEGEEPVTPLEDGSGLVALMSFALSRGFGAQHPLIALADRLHDQHHVPLGPLTTFYEAGPEDAEDAEKLEHAWQPASDLRASLAAVTCAIRGDEQSQALVRRAGVGDIAAEARSLLPALDAATAAGRRARLVYSL